MALCQHSMQENFLLHRNTHGRIKYRTVRRTYWNIRFKLCFYSFRIPTCFLKPVLLSVCTVSLYPTPSSQASPGCQMMNGEVFPPFLAACETCHAQFHPCPCPWYPYPWFGVVIRPSLLASFAKDETRAWFKEEEEITWFGHVTAVFCMKRHLLRTTWNKKISGRTPGGSTNRTFRPKFLNVFKTIDWKKNRLFLTRKFTRFCLAHHTGPKISTDYQKKSGDLKSGANSAQCVYPLRENHSTPYIKLY